MLKVLLKKELLGIFQMYFVNRKTGKARSKGQIAGFFVLFFGILLLLSGSFFVISFSVGYPMVKAGYGSLYLSLAAALAVGVGVFGSAFNTYQSLYLAKDNDFLFSLPVRPRDILLSRMLGVFLMSLLFSGVLWLPCVVFYTVFGAGSLASVLFGILDLILIALFVSVLTCLLGFIIAAIASRLRNKGIVTMIVTALFLIVYYYLIFNLNNIADGITANLEPINAAFRKYLVLFCFIGDSAAGDPLSFLWTFLIVAALSVLCLFVMSKTFRRIALRTVGVKKAAYVATGKVQKNVRMCLLNRELKKFSSSTVYMMNCGLGIVLLPVLAIAAVIKADAVRTVVATFGNALGMTDPTVLVSAAVILIVTFILSMDQVTEPSISMEGKNLWLLKSLPVTAKDVLNAKLSLQLVTNVIPAVVTVAVLGIFLNAGAASTILLCAYSVEFIAFTAYIGLVFGLKYPNLHWTNEGQVVKQDMHLLLSMLVDWAVGIVSTLVVAFFAFYAGSAVPLAVLCVLLGAFNLLLDKWMRNKGTKIFAEL